MGQADEQASFAVNLEDGTSKSALTAADALVRLKKQLEGDTQALGALQRAMKNLQGGTSVNIDQFKALEKQIAATKQRVAQGTSSILQLGGSLKKSSGGGSKQMASILEQLQKNATGLGGPLGQVTGRLASLRGLVGGGVIALGLVAIVAGIAALTAASIVATVALLKYGIAQADARRNELLRLEGLTKLRSWYGLAAGNANEMQVALDKVSASSAIGRGKLSEYSAQLYKMGLRGQNLSDALEGVATKAAVQGDVYAQRFAGMAAAAAFSGRSVRKLADDVKARLGGIASKQMLSLGVQTEKLHESFAALFNTLKIEGFLRGLNTLTQLFSQNTATGRALRVLVENIFQPLIDAVTAAAPIVKRFFQGMVISALLVGISVLKVRNALRDAFGSSESVKGMDLANAAAWAGVAAFSLLAGAVGALVIVMGVLMSPVLAAAAVLYSFYSTGKMVYDLWQGIDWKGMGSAMVDGILGGLKSGATAVIDAVKRLAGSVTGAFKGALKIQSPSKVFAKLGLAIPQGIEAGVDIGTPSLTRSIGNVVDAPTAPRLSGRGESAPSPAAVPMSAPSSASSSASVTIGELHVHTQSDKPKEVALDLKRELERILEGLAVSMGAPLPGGA